MHIACFAVFMGLVAAERSNIMQVEKMSYAISHMTEVTLQVETLQFCAMQAPGAFTMCDFDVDERLDQISAELQELEEAHHDIFLGLNHAKVQVPKDADIFRIWTSPNSTQYQRYLDVNPAPLMLTNRGALFTIVNTLVASAHEASLQATTAWLTSVPLMTPGFVRFLPKAVNMLATALLFFPSGRPSGHHHPTHARILPCIP